MTQDQLLAEGPSIAGVLVVTRSVGQADIGAQLAAVLAEVAARTDWSDRGGYTQQSLL